jgi:hypothetical protein
MTVKKYCAACQRALPRAAFGRHQGRWDGLQPWCTTCTRRAVRQRRARLREGTRQALLTRTPQKETPHA